MYASPFTRVLRAAPLPVLLAAGWVLRIRFALADDGLYWPDEIYQSVEPAHRLVFGYGLTAWEFIDGARPWVFPALVAGVLKGLSGLGLEAPGEYLVGLRVLLCTLGTATAYGCYRLARACGASFPSGLLAAALFSFAAPALYFAPRALSETASALPVVFGFAWALPPDASRRKRLAGTALLGFSVWLRLQNAPFCAVILGVWALRRERRTLVEGAAMLAGWAAGLGALDLATWGSWFHSARVYLTFNLLEGKASGWGTAHPVYYLWRLLTSMPTVGPLLLGLSLAAARVAPALLVAAGAVLALHSAVPHKELRFVFPVLPLLCALAAMGWDRLRAASPPRVRALGWGALATSLLLSAASLGRLTFGALGQYGRARRFDSALDDGGAVNRLLLRAHALPDLCGLKVETRHLAWTGGHSYLHRPVPLYGTPGPARSTGHFNYAVTGRGGPGREVAAEGSQALVRLRADCVPDPSYTWRLP